MNTLLEDMSTEDLEALKAQLEETGTTDQSDKQLEGYDLTELGNAKRFANRFRGELLYVPDHAEWFYWNGKLWNRNTNGHDLRQFEGVIAELKTEQHEVADRLTALDPESQEAKAVRTELQGRKSWSKASQKLSVMKNSISLAAVQEGMCEPLKEFDRKGHYFGCANGIIDLRDRRLITGDKTYLMTKASPVPYEPDAQCPKWDEFLLRIMNGNVDNVSFLQRLVGQAMLGTHGKDKLAILWGSGANGKSTFVDTLHRVFGDYATVTDPRMLMDSGRANREYYLAPLKGVRLVLMSETKRGDMIAESIVKTLVDGGEITARYPAGRVFTFQPVFTPILSTNHRPKVGADPAIWRRVLLVPFTHVIPAEERNPRFRSEVLAPEAAGILRWCVDGAIAFRRDGLAPTGDVVDATEEYKRSQDKIGLFVSEECTVDTGARIRLMELLTAYNDWCTQQGLQTMGRTTFKEELLTKSYAVRPSTGNVDWVFGLAKRSWVPTVKDPDSSIASIAKGQIISR